MGDVGRGVQAAAGIADATIGAFATTEAAHIGADATKYASDNTSQSAANSLAFNKDVYGTTLTNEQPYMATGSQATGALSAGLADGSLTDAYAPKFSFSGVNLQNDPAYQFDLSQGTAAMDRSAAARGGLISGGQQKDINDYAQGFAANQYQQSYQNSLAAYNQAYQQYETAQGNRFNRLSSAAGLGQNAVTQTATSGNAAASTNAGVNASTANTLANLATGNASNTTAAIGAGLGAVTGGINTVANSLATQDGSSYNAAGLAAMAPTSIDYGRAASEQ